MQSSSSFYMYDTLDTNSTFSPTDFHTSIFQLWSHLFQMELSELYLPQKKYFGKYPLLTINNAENWKNLQKHENFRTTRTDSLLVAISAIIPDTTTSSIDFNHKNFQPPTLTHPQRIIRIKTRESTSQRILTFLKMIEGQLLLHGQNAVHLIFVRSTMFVEMVYQQIIGKILIPLTII